MKRTGLLILAVFCIFTWTAKCQLLLHIDWKKPFQPAFYLSGIPGDSLLINETFDNEMCQRYFLLHVNREHTAATSNVEGRYEFLHDTLFFQPYLPLNSDLLFQVRLGKQELPLIFPWKMEDDPHSAVIQQRFPVGDTLPLNTLVFYLKFDRKMKRDEQAYRFVELIDESGNVIPQVWRHRSFWIEMDRVLVLMIHPGRIKRGIHATSDLGDVLIEGKHYEVVLKNGLMDANGKAVSASKVFRFVAGAKDEQLPTWLHFNHNSPAAGGHNAIELLFNEEMDYGLVVKWIKVIAAQGNVKGSWASEDGKSWRFTPQVAWNEGPYRLTMGNHLGDPAHNQLDRKFEERSSGNFTTDTLHTFDFYVR
jgi:hypothetical protein